MQNFRKKGRSLSRLRALNYIARPRGYGEQSGARSSAVLAKTKPPPKITGTGATSAAGDLQRVERHVPKNWTRTKATCPSQESGLFVPREARSRIRGSKKHGALSDRRPASFPLTTRREERRKEKVRCMDEEGDRRAPRGASLAIEGSTVVKSATLAGQE
ncbi:hypothetical protein KM043_014290 [Ampulex compressa]|nr:hypothetical protein KM043_014290 [Ampulex compressa]